MHASSQNGIVNVDTQNRMVLPRETSEWNTSIMNSINEKMEFRSRISNNILGIEKSLKKDFRPLEL